MFSLRMFQKKKINHLNFSADVLLNSISVTFADGVQPLELGGRPTNHFGQKVTKIQIVKELGGRPTNYFVQKDTKI